VCSWGCDKWQRGSARTSLLAAMACFVKAAKVAGTPVSRAYRAARVGAGACRGAYCLPGSAIHGQKVASAAQSGECRYAGGLAIGVARLPARYRPRTMCMLYGP